jgi:hypothetical protein
LTAAVVGGASWLNAGADCDEAAGFKFKFEVEVAKAEMLVPWKSLKLLEATGTATPDSVERCDVAFF